MKQFVFVSLENRLDSWRPPLAREVLLFCFSKLTYSAKLIISFGICSIVCCSGVLCPELHQFPQQVGVMFGVVASAC